MPIYTKIEIFWKSQQPILAELLTTLSEKKGFLSLSTLSSVYKPNIRSIFKHLATTEKSLENLSSFNSLLEHAIELFSRAEIASQQIMKIHGAGLDVVISNEQRARLAKLFLVA
jgi:hypothetical protein